MKIPGHLRLDEIHLAPGQEWHDESSAWRFLRLRSGAAYWLGAGPTRFFAEGEMVVVVPKAKGMVRASQLGEVVLQEFSFNPELLCGFFTLAERHLLEKASALLPSQAQFLPSTHPLNHRIAALAAPEEPEMLKRAEVLGLAIGFFAEKMPPSTPSQNRVISAQTRFQQLIAQMPDMEMINHSPEQLANLCGCSPRHFTRLFHQHFGESPRERQTELRLLKASQLLCATEEKVIHVALESGYRSLSLFNVLFKKKFGMSPSEWRQKALKKEAGLCSLLLVLGLWLGSPGAYAGESNCLATAAVAASPEPAPCESEVVFKARQALRQKMAELDDSQQTPRLPGPRARRTLKGAATAAGTTNGPVFRVTGYNLKGNTLLPPEVTDPILQDYTGPAVTVEGIRQALAELQMAYRERGFVTVGLALPPQQLTNGVVQVQVTEGRLTDITIHNNRYFSSNNIMRELPCLHSNTILNGLVLQQELDRANANKDRQIYPVLGPGPEPGTSSLELKVKDRLPLHAHFDVNNYSTPNTPELRANAAAVYNNLWQLNHQFGAQYSFTPEAYKEGDFNFYDRPLIANYSAYYRMPLAGVNGPPRTEDYPLSSFGYNEATRRFQAPPPTGTSDLLFYASRSSSDTGEQVQSDTLTPAVLPAAGGLQISDRVVNRTVNPNEDLGTRFSTPLPLFADIGSTLAAGLDFKNYRSTLVQNRTFQANLYVPEVGSSGPPFTVFPSPPTSQSRTIFTSVQYLPLALSYDLGKADRFGSTSFTLGQSFNVAGLLSGSKDFQAVSGSTNASGTYYVVTAGLTREQNIWHGWGVRLHSDGQWANEPLISNEQFSLGGQAGVRGYRDGAQYGDTGWRVQCEPHTPYVNLGMVNDIAPLMARGYVFLDYGERYLLDPNGRPAAVSMLGTGAGVDMSIGEHWDMHLLLGLPLQNTPDRESGHLRATFSLSVQL